MTTGARVNASRVICHLSIALTLSLLALRLAGAETRSSDKARRFLRPLLSLRAPRAAPRSQTPDSANEYHCCLSNSCVAVSAWPRWTSLVRTAQSLTRGTCGSALGDVRATQHIMWDRTVCVTEENRDTGRCDKEASHACEASDNLQRAPLHPRIHLMHACVCSQVTHHESEIIFRPSLQLFTEQRRRDTTPRPGPRAAALIQRRRPSHERVQGSSSAVARGAGTRSRSFIRA